MFVELLLTIVVTVVVFVKGHMEYVEKLLAVVVTPCLEEDEAYIVRSSKLLVIAFACIAINALFLGVPVTVLGAMYDPTPGVYAVGASLVQVSITGAVFPYLYLRKTRRLPEWLPAIQIWSTVPTTISFGLFSHQGSIVVVSTFAILIGVIMRVRGWYLLLFYGVCINCVHALINDFGDSLPSLHNTLYHTQILSVKIMYLIGCNLFPVVSFGGGLFAIMKEFVQRADEADAAIAMNLAVAEKLRRYDTDGVAVILAANRGKVDENLLEAFAGIQRNLEEFRPHIPDYVIEASKTTTNGDSTSTDDEGTLQEHSTATSACSALFHFADNTSNHSSQSSRHAKIAHPLDGGNPSFRGIDETSLTTEGNTTASTFKSTNHHEILSDSKRPLGVKGRLNGSGSGIERALTTASRPHFFGKATTVFIRFNQGTDAGSSISRSSVATTMASLNKCLELVAVHAKAHNGAIQYMQGCGLAVSFNAVSRVATHECKACAFALALHESIEGLPNTHRNAVHTSIVTSNVLSFFAGNASHLLLTVVGGFMAQHSGMQQFLSEVLGTRTHCITVSQETLPAIEMLFNYRRIGEVTLLPERRRLPICQLLTLSAQLHNEDEWMYHHTQKPQQSESAKLLDQVLASALEGSIQVATPVHNLEECDDVVADACILKRVEHCRATGASFALPVAPIALW